MKRKLQILLASCFCLLMPGLTHANPSDSQLDSSPINIGIPQDVLEDYNAFIQGRDPVNITDYSGPNSRRDVVEVILFQQALMLGGITNNITFTGVPTYRRLLTEVKEGALVGAATSAWLYDLENEKENLLISDAVIENGNFEAGLYTNAKNTKVLEANTLKKIKGLSAASNRYWTPDWRTLSHLGLSRLIHIQDWKTMVRTVYHQRADFLLAPFQQTQGMRLDVDGMTLIPIQGVKVGLEGSRHFAISRHHPKGKTIFRAFQKGLAILMKRGTLKQAYRESGFYNEKAQNWRFLN